MPDSVLEEPAVSIFTSAVRMEEAALSTTSFITYKSQSRRLKTGYLKKCVVYCSTCLPSVSIRGRMA
jgi:aerobic-type carbon monoxide dehydrogenase small subunit (CoxS/CutS family)